MRRTREEIDNDIKKPLGNDAVSIPAMQLLVGLAQLEVLLDIREDIEKLAGTVAKDNPERLNVYSTGG